MKKFFNQFEGKGATKAYKTCQARHQGKFTEEKPASAGHLFILDMDERLEPSREII